MSVAIVGSVSLDRVEGRPPRIGGCPYYAARALRSLHVRAVIAAKCAAPDRSRILPPLAQLGIPVLWRDSTSTAAFTIDYNGEHRRMFVDAIADPWTAEEARVPGATWVHAAPLARSDFPPETLAALARGRRLSLDGQGLVRPARLGPLEPDADYDPELLRSVSILKLAEEEAELLVEGLDERALRRLGVPEVVVTLGSRGCIVSAPHRPPRRDGPPPSSPTCWPGGPHEPPHAADGEGDSGEPRGSPLRGTPGSPGCRGKTASDVIAHVQTADGLAVVDLEDETVLELDSGSTIERAPQPPVSLPRVITAAATGSTIVAVVDAKPPLLVSHDAGRTWRDSGRGLPAGRAVAISPDDPDVILYGARNRLYLSRDGGRFWRGLALELPEIEAVSL